MLFSPTENSLRKEMFLFGSSFNALYIVGNQKYLLNESSGGTRLGYNIFFGVRMKKTGGIIHHWNINTIYLPALLSSVYSLMPTQSLIIFNLKKEPVGYFGFNLWRKKENKIIQTLLFHHWQLIISLSSHWAFLKGIWEIHLFPDLTF